MKIFLPLLLLFEKVIAFLKQIIIADFFGSTYRTDAYQMAENLVSIIRGGLCNAIPVIFLTLIVESKTKKQKNILEYKSNIFSVVVIFSFFVTVFFDLLICLLRGYYNQDDFFSLFSKYVLIISVAITLALISGMLGAILEAEEIYLPSKLLSGFTSISVIIFVLIFFDKFNIISILIGEIFALILHIIVLIFCSKKYDVLIFCCKPLVNADVIKIFELSLPLIFSSSIVSINSLIDKMIARSVGDGAASVLQYSRTLTIELFPSILVMAFSSVLVGSFVKCIANNNQIEFENLINVNLKFFVTILLVVEIISFVFSEEIIKIVYFRGAFDEKALRLTIRAFKGYSFGIAVFPIREISMRVLYSLKLTKESLRTSVIGVLINLIFSIVLVSKFDVYGISLATSISILVTGIINLGIIKKKNNYKFEISLKEIIGFSIIGIGCIVVTSCAKVLFTGVISLIIATISCIFIVGYIGLRFRISYFYYYFKLIFEKKNNKDKYINNCER